MTWVYVNNKDFFSIKETINLNKKENFDNKRGVFRFVISGIGSQSISEIYLLVKLLKRGRINSISLRNNRQHILLVKPKVFINEYIFGDVIDFETKELINGSNRLSKKDI